MQAVDNPAYFETSAGADQLWRAPGVFDDEGSYLTCDAVAAGEYYDYNQGSQLIAA